MKTARSIFKTKPERWRVLKDGRMINPVPYTGESEEFSVKITDEEVLD